MMAELEHLGRDGPELRRAAGCVRASYRTPRTVDVLGYSGLLAFSMAALMLMQWRQGEGPTTYVVLSAVALILGLGSPHRFLLSGAVMGTVVAAVNCFGAVSGIQPAYESTPHSASMACVGGV